MADGKLTFLRPLDPESSGKLVLGDAPDVPPPQQITGLVFSKPATGSGRLTFGKWTEGGEQPIPDAEISIDAGVAGEGRASVQLRVAALASVDAGISGEGTVDVGLLWDANVSRGGVRAELETGWQQARPVAAGLAVAWQQAAPLRVGTALRWQDAAPVRGSLAAGWQNAERLRAAVAVHWREGERRRAALDARWQEAVRLRAAVAVRWQEGERRRAVLDMQWQEALRLRAAARTHWQEAAPRRAAFIARYGPGLPVHIHLHAHWQEAMRPRAGITRPTTPPGPRPPCYDPARLGRLVFAEPASVGGRLVFVCPRRGPDPEPPRYVIPLLRVYVTVHSISAVLLPSLEPVDLLGAVIECDDGGFGWSLTADGPEHLLDQLAPVSGLPARVRIAINGIDWIFAIERISRTRRFGQHRASVQGRSVTALLGDPYMPPQSWLNTGALMAQQLVEQALQFTGATIDWGMQDWLVPAGVWSFQGTPLQAALRVAEAAGAVLRSHRTESRLIFAPRYPVLPWAWGAAAPDVQMPAAIITTDSLDPEPRPAYNAVYVSGMAQGILAHVRRAGSAGDLLAPQATDPLITHELAARQRGSAVLGAAGGKLMQAMTLPWLTDEWSPGLIPPGYLIEVDDIGHTWRGQVRGTRITAGMPVVRQTITVERNAA